ncbi:hypothetical protein JST97_14855 [bacterium]|nr:hypothetical protein [bacterium]
MRLLSNSLVILALLTSLGRALPNDQQVIALYQQWCGALTQAASFNSLAPLLSRSACQRIILLTPDQQQDFFRSVKSGSVIEASASWGVQTRFVEGGSLVYVLLNRDTSSKAVLRVVEEEGRLKVDLTPP